MNTHKEEKINAEIDATEKDLDLFQTADNEGPAHPTTVFVD